MKNKKIRIFSIVFGILLALFLIFNFGLNFWLKKNLPNYIKNNSEYIVNYKTMDVDLGTGNILSTGISINTQNPQNQEIIGLQGTIDTLSISRLGIYDLIFNKNISTSKVTLASPNLNVILSNKKDKKSGKKDNPLEFDKIKITNGNIQVFRPTKQKILSVKDLNLDVDDLNITGKSAEGELPFSFEK